MPQSLICYENRYVSPFPTYNGYLKYFGSHNEWMTDFQLGSGFLFLRLALLWLQGVVSGKRSSPLPTHKWWGQRWRAMTERWVSQEIHSIRDAKELSSSVSSTARWCGQDTVSFVLICQKSELMLTLPPNSSDLLWGFIRSGDMKSLENHRRRSSGKNCSYTGCFRYLVLRARDDLECEIFVCVRIQG